METLKQRILEHIAYLLDEPTFELDMRLADCIDPLPSDKSELHLMMTDAAFKVLCNYFGKQDNTKQYDIHGVSQRSELFALLKYLNPDPHIDADDNDINEILDEYYKANYG